MSLIKRALSEEAMDALEDVQEGLISMEEWLEEYQPQYVDPVEKGGELV